MWCFLRFFLLCVAISISISGADESITYVDLDISNPGSDFNKVDYPNYSKIDVSDEALLLKKCVGKVTDGSKEILPAPDSRVTYRYVKVVKVPKEGDYNPELEDAVNSDQQPGGQCSFSNYDRVVEINTYYGRTRLADRFKKNSSDLYERFDYELVDVDICNELLTTVEFNNNKYFKVDRYKTVGSVKCKDQFLLDSMNVFYRTVKVLDSLFVVTTVPRLGIPNILIYNLHGSKEYVVTKRTYRDQLSLDLSNLTDVYSKMLSPCGTECSFFDGCNEKHTLVDVIEDGKYVYKNRNTFCLSVKKEEVRGEKYLIIYDLHRNSTLFLVKILKKNGSEYLEHNKQTIDLDLTVLTAPRPVEHIFKDFVKTENLHPNFRTRVMDIDYTIGKIKFDGNVVLEEGENVVNREVYSSADGILVRDDHYNGEFRTYLFRPEKPKTDADGSTVPVSNEPKPALEDPVKVDLHHVTSHVTKYLTDSTESLFIKPTTIVDKIGSVSYDGLMASPNKFFVSRQYLVMGENFVKSHCLNRRGMSSFESFVKIVSIEGKHELFVSKAKELLDFDVLSFYEAFLSKKLSPFINFDINNLGDYYYVGASYKKLYTAMVGNVTCRGDVFAPLDTDLTSRFLILPKNTQSFVVIRDCDGFDCWFRTYKQTSGGGKLGYEIQKKTPVDLDLLKVFENDRDPKKKHYTFDHFTVYKQDLVYAVRIKDDFKQKIGKVLYKGNVLIQDDDVVFTRMVNVTYKKDSDPSTDKVNGNFRLLDVERWEKSTKLYTYELEGDNFVLTLKPKSDYDLDLEPAVRKNQNLNISERDEVLSYYLNWNLRDDYNLKKISRSKFNSTSEKWEPVSVKEGLDDFPVFLRLHKDEEQNNFVLVVENHGKHEKPKNGEFFKVTKNAAQKGLILKFDISNNSSEELQSYHKDSYHRRNFTSHRHEFIVSLESDEDSKSSDL